MDNLKEIKKEEVLKLNKDEKYYCYNPLTDTWHEEIVGKNDIAHNKYAYSGLKFFIKNN
jgi:acyl-CoA synthetase (AMP-forming)/AMP-acid ligase II